MNPPPHRRAQATPPPASVLSRLVLRPWFDRVALRGLARWYFPLSRAWAAAAGADSADTLAAALGRPDLRSRRGKKALATVTARRAAYESAAAAWEEAFFGAR